MWHNSLIKYSIVSIFSTVSLIGTSTFFDLSTNFGKSQKNHVVKQKRRGLLKFIESSGPNLLFNKGTLFMEFFL